MSGTVIEIDRVPLTLVAATSPDRAERVSRRVRDAVARTLPAALASACGRELDADDAYVFIDRLDVQCSVATHWADDAIAALFAERLARALGLERSLGRALVFRDRAEFLSAFLAAAADGRAFTRWWFAEFDGLAALPASACIRTLTIAEGPLAWEALARLSSESLLRVVSTLTAPDAERVLTAVAGESPGTAVSVRMLIAALESAMAVSLPTRFHRLVASLIHVVRSGAGASARNLGALRAVVDLVEAARCGRLVRFPQEASAAVVLTWCEAAGVGDVDRARALDLDASALVEYVVSQMPERPASETASTTEAPFDYTPFGGALLLCVVLVRTGWWSAWRDALRAASFEERADPLAGWLALAVVARALSPDRPARVECDPVLRRVFGAPDAPRPALSDRATTRALQSALKAAAPATSVRPDPHHLGPRLRAWARALLVECGQRIPGCDRSSATYLRTQCLSLPAAVRADGNAARLGRAPLDVLLVFSGLKRAAVTLPDGRPLSLGDEITW